MGGGAPKTTAEARVKGCSTTADGRSASEGGAELAHFLAKQGYDLVITARGEDALEQTAHSLEAYGGRVTSIAGDVSDAGHRERLGRAAQDLGGLDLLINNASDLGVSPLPSLTTYPLDAIENVLRVNVIAPLALVQQTLPQLRQRAGLVVNISSDASTRD